MINRKLLRKLRKEKRFRQIDMAERAKITQPYYAELESGRKTRPSVEVLVRLAKILDTDLTALISGKGAK